MSKLRIVLSLASLAAMLALTAGPSSSAGIGLDVSPAKLELSIPAGTSYNIPLTIRNSSGDPVHIQAQLVDFGVKPDGDYLFARVGTRPNSLMRWASINPREFDLPAGTTQQVRLSLAIPNERSLSGEYAGIVFFQTRPVRRAGAVSFSARVGTKIYATIPGTVKIDGAIAKMTAQTGPAGELYRVLFKNTGNAHVYLRGQVEIQRGGETVDRMQMPSEMLVERGGERLIDVIGKRLAPGNYQAIATIDYGGKAMTGGEIGFEVR